MANIVLDLDETLIHTIQITQKYSAVLAMKTDFNFKIDGQFYWVLKRPGLDLFLDFLFKYFQVGIWTAADKGYAKEICKKILTYDQLKKIRFIYSRNFCHLDRELVMFTKPLAKIFEIYPDFNPHNTLMLDNTANVMRYNPQNAVYIPDYINQVNDDVLYVLRNATIKYYQKKPLNTPIWELVQLLNRSLRKNTTS